MILNTHLRKDGIIAAYQSEKTYHCRQFITFVIITLMAFVFMGSVIAAADVSGPVRHSNDPLNGSKWNGPYWTSESDSCLYCHGLTSPNATDLGKPASFQGDNVVGGNLAGTWCLQCHLSTAENYTEMVNIMDPVPPAITPGPNYPSGAVDHTNFAKSTDSDCAVCHYADTPDNITQFMHDVKIGTAGGKDCRQCHNGSGIMAVDISSMNSADYNHYNLNSGSITGPYDPVNRMCWACHTNNTSPYSDQVDESELPDGVHPDSYNLPKKCVDCHTGTVKFGAAKISEHFPVADELKTEFTCVQCHENSIMPFVDSQTNLSTNNDTGNPDFEIGKISHYANTNNLVSSVIYVDNEYCEKCHNDALTAPEYGVTKLVARHDSKDCTQSACHNFYINSLHESNLKMPVVYFLRETNNYCTNCHPYPGEIPGFHGNSTKKVICDACHLNASITVNKNTITPGIRNTNTIYHTDDPVPSFTYNGLGPGNRSLPYNSVEYNRSRCNICHDAANEYHFSGIDCTVCHLSNNVKPVWHSSELKFLAGGADCVGCHGTGGILEFIDDGAIKLGAHADLNSGASNTTVIDPLSKACWACHGNGTEPLGSHPANYKTPHVCSDCHINTDPATNFTAPQVIEHREGAPVIMTAGITCSVCHNNSLVTISYDNRFGISSGGNPQNASTSHYLSDANEFLMTDTIHSNDCRWCHIINNLSEEWGTPFDPRGSTEYPHFEQNIDQNTDCYRCHGGLDNSVKLHDSGFLITSSCSECHREVSSTDLGRHSTLNGTSDVDDGDCNSCHHDPFPMVTGAVNTSNTYYCPECHTSGSTNPKKSSILFTEKKHGQTACIDCHIADGSYHQDNPRGAVANPAYVSRYSTGNLTVTDCADCHYASNLDDAPFFAPGGGSHTKSACADGGCHATTKIMVETVHNVVMLGNKLIIPSISVPTLSSGIVVPGTDVTVTATVTTGGYRDYVDGAQYRLMSGSTQIIPWTPMSALDGNFGGTSDTATAVINTSALSGEYSVQVRGMAGGPRQNTSIRYYPMNGNVSAAQSATLTVEFPRGYINGTVLDSVSKNPIADATVKTNTNVMTTTTDSGAYSLKVPEGAYSLEVTSPPEYYANLSVTVSVTSGVTTYQDIYLLKKPAGNITGTVKIAEV